MSTSISPAASMEPGRAMSGSDREITMSQAIREALAEEMRRDPNVYIMGEDVAEAGTPFKVLSGLVTEFGTERVIDSPISEAGITGIAVGAAMTGMRPVVDIMFGDFLPLAMEQIVNQAAKIHYMSGGKLKAPMVVRTTAGRDAPLGGAAQPEPARLVEPHTRIEGRPACDAVRRQGVAEDRYPR